MAHEREQINTTHMETRRKKSGDKDATITTSQGRRRNKKAHNDEN